MKIDHNIVHCGNQICKDRNKCKRYVAFLDVKNTGYDFNEGEHLVLYPNSTIDNRDKCKLPWKGIDSIEINYI